MKNIVIKVQDECMHIRIAAKYEPDYFKDVDMGTDFNKEDTYSFLNKMSIAFRNSAEMYRMKGLNALAEEHRNYAEAFHDVCKKAGCYKC